ncbi:MAG: hypothetical protein MR966_05210 [Lachnospiraceae bacterium]|nr:hypothetical protein [Lachnospiraceae bacterium]
MSFQNSKLYINNGRIENVEYNPSVNIYYSLVERYHKLGYKQIIISSNLMLEILKYYFVQRNYKICKIEFIEDDEEFSEEINSIIRELATDRSKWNKFVNKIDFLIENYSIDINKITMIGCNRNKSGSTEISVQLNGILIIDSEDYSFEVNSICNILERYFEK